MFFLEVAKDNDNRECLTLSTTRFEVRLCKGAERRKYKKDYRHTREPRNESTKFPDKFSFFLFLFIEQHPYVNACDTRFETDREWISVHTYCFTTFSTVRN